MAAPTVQFVKSNTSNSATITADGDATTTTVAVGDLCVITREAQGSGSGSEVGPTYTTGGADAGFSGVALTTAGTNNGRCRTWAKILTSGDFSGSNLKGFSFSLSTYQASRTQVWVIRDANGVGWATLGTYTNVVVSSTANIAAPATYATDNPSPDAPCILFALFGAASAGTTQQFTWDSGTIRDPYCDDSSGGTTTTGGHGNHYATGSGTAQSDYQEYALADSPTQVIYQVGTANTTHASQVVLFKTVAAVTGVASLAGGGAFAATGTHTVLGTASLSGGGAFSSSATHTVLGVAALAGGGTFSAAQQGAATITGVASLSGGGAFTATGTHVVLGTSASLAGGGTFHSSAAPTIFGTASLTGGGTFHSAAIIGSFPVGTGGSWSAGGASGAGGQSWTGIATMAGGGAFHTTGVGLGPGAGLAHMDGGGLLAAAAVVTINSFAALYGGGTFAAVGTGLGDQIVRGQFRPRQRGIVRG